MSKQATKRISKQAFNEAHRVLTFGGSLQEMQRARATFKRNPRAFRFFVNFEAICNECGVDYFAL
jgi:hypothetical protein